MEDDSTSIEKGAVQAPVPRPRPMAIRLVFEFGVAGERTQVPRRRVETIGLMFEASADKEAVEASLATALELAGARCQDVPKEKRWVSVGVGGRLARSLAVDLVPPGMDLGAMPSEEEALEEIAKMTRQIAHAVSEASGSCGWRRADDMEGAASVSQAVGMAFDDLEALQEAIQIKRELNGAASQGCIVAKRSPL